MSNWYVAIRDWSTWMDANGARPLTIRLRRVQLSSFATAMAPTSPWSVSADQVVEWFSGRDWRPETRRSYLAAVRSFYRWAELTDRAPGNPTTTIRRVAVPTAHPRPAPESDIAAARVRADERQALMIDLGARHGLRRAEIAQVHTADLIDDGAGDFSLHVRGKGERDRVVPLLPDTARILRQAPAGWVFPNGLGGHLSPGHVGVLITRALPPGVTPHMLRHRYATVVYRSSHDLLTLRELLGHATVTTTQRYAAPDPATRRRVSAAAA